MDLANAHAFPKLCRDDGPSGHGKLFGKSTTDATQVPDEADQTSSLVDLWGDSDDEDMTAVDKSPWAVSPVSFRSSFADAFGDLRLDEDSKENSIQVEDPLLQSEVPSVGSLQHGSGDCKPCAWFWKSQGCQNGRDCMHCHLCPKTEVKARKKLKTKIRKDMEANMVNLWPPPGLEPLACEPPSQVSLAPSFAASLNMSEKSQEPQYNADKSSTAVTAAISIVTEDEVLGSSALGRLADFSVGSVQHSSGLCKPCSWYWKPEGCHNGRECLHCHLCPKNEVKARKKLNAKICREEEASVVAPRGVEPPASEQLTPAWCLPAVAARLDVLENLQDPWFKAHESHSASTTATSLAPSEDEAPERLSAISVGSALHLSGCCKPCTWYWKAQGCSNGEDCLHCHICTEDEIKRRKKVHKKIGIARKCGVKEKDLPENSILVHLQQQQRLIQQQQQQLCYMQMQLNMKEHRSQVLLASWRKAPLQSCQTY